MPGTPTLFPPGQPAAVPPRSTRDLVAVLYRQAGLIAVCTLVGTAASLALYMKQPRTYASSAKVWVQTEQQGSPSFLSGIAAYRETAYPDPVNRKIETEIALMLTRSNAQSVVERFNIRSDQLAKGGKAGAPAAAASASVASDPRAAIVDLFIDGLSVEPVRSKTADTASNVLEVKFECADPALAPVALQAFIDNYLQLGAQQNHRLGETTAKLIGTQLDQAKEDLRASEDRIVALLVQDGGRSGRAGAALSDSSAIGSAYAAAGATTDSGLRLDLGADSGNEGTARIGNGATQAMESLKARTLELQASLDAARQLYTDDSESVRNLRAQLASAQARLERTSRQGAQLDAEMSRLQRQRQLAQERYVELQRKLDQIDLYLQLNPTEAESRVLIDAPTHPGTAEGQKKKLVALVGPIGGLLLGLLLAALRELGGERMRSPREVEWALGVTLLGAIPSLSNKARNAYTAPTAMLPVLPTEPA